MVVAVVLSAIGISGTAPPGEARGRSEATLTPVACASGLGGAGLSVLRVEPTDCLLAGGRQNSDVIGLERLSWGFWGRQGARGHGYLESRGTASAVAIRLLRPALSCDGSGRVFTRARTRTKTATVLRILDRPCDHARHRRAFRVAVFQEIETTAALARFRSPRLQCHVGLAANLRRERWLCSGHFRWRDPDRGACKQVFRGHFDLGRGAGEVPELDTLTFYVSQSFRAGSCRRSS